MLASFETLDRLARMHLRWRCEDHGFNTRLLERLAEIGSPVRNLVLLRDLFRGLGAPARERDDFNAADLFDRVEVLLAKGALAGHHDFHAFPQAFSRMMWPSAVFD